MNAGTKGFPQDDRYSVVLLLCLISEVLFSW